MSMEHWLFMQITSKRPFPTSQKTYYLTIMKLKLSLCFREIIAICSENNNGSIIQSVDKVLTSGSCSRQYRDTPWASKHLWQRVTTDTVGCWRAAVYNNDKWYT
jgi:hypothetical protein